MASSKRSRGSRAAVRPIVTRDAREAAPGTLEEANPQRNYVASVITAFLKVGFVTG